MINNHGQLRWACRRGMLELDILLSHFLDEHYVALSLEEQECFQRLLKQADTDLMFWVLGHAQPRDPSLMNIVRLIRTYACT